VDFDVGEFRFGVEIRGASLGTVVPDTLALLRHEFLVILGIKFDIGDLGPFAVRPLPGGEIGPQDVERGLARCGAEAGKDAAQNVGDRVLQHGTLAKEVGGEEADEVYNTYFLLRRLRTGPPTRGESMKNEMEQMRAALQRIDAWFAKHRPRFAKGLHPAAAEADLKGLPEPLHTLLAWHNGQNDDFVGCFEEH